MHTSPTPSINSVDAANISGFFMVAEVSVTPCSMSICSCLLCHHSQTTGRIAMRKSRYALCHSGLRCL